MQINENIYHKPLFRTTFRFSEYTNKLGDNMHGISQRFVCHLCAVLFVPYTIHTVYPLFFYYDNTNINFLKLFVPLNTNSSIQGTTFIEDENGQKIQINPSNVR